ncbi:MAG: hypothetical protein DRO14_00420 [Thermoprotei archaeon]|nr:MAG: hypothetical protein DRO14_00015 [Thermoprotei archaeon]RLG78613.1 MAG: hypothetical protein DRO14_00420 [Thermoprotei archaeon]
MRRWSKEEIEVLRKVYPDAGAKKVAELIGRSVDSVVAKAKELGIRRKRKVVWTDEMVGFLVSNYNVMTMDEIAEYLGVDSVDVLNKARQLGLKKNHHGRVTVVVDDEYVTLEPDDIIMLYENGYFDNLELRRLCRFKFFRDYINSKIGGVLERH